MFSCFLRDARAECNDVSTTPNQTADADTCSLAWAETATTPKQRKLRPSNTKETNQPRSRNGLGSLFALGMSLSLLCLNQPRAPSDSSLDADTCSLECWAETAPTPKQRLQSCPNLCTYCPWRRPLQRMHAFIDYVLQSFTRSIILVCFIQFCLRNIMFYSCCFFFSEEIRKKIAEKLTYSI